jgi:hypothetical protein
MQIWNVVSIKIRGRNPDCTRILILRRCVLMSRPFAFQCTGMPNEVRIRVKERAESSIGAPKSKRLADGFAANNRGGQIGGRGIAFDCCGQRRASRGTLETEFELRASIEKCPVEELFSAVSEK